MNERARQRIRKALSVPGARLTSKRQVCKAAGGDTGTVLATLGEMLELGEVAEQDGALCLTGADLALPQASVPELPDLAFGESSPGAWGTNEGLAEIYDSEIRATRQLLDAKRKVARRGDATTELTGLTRVISELIRRRRELISDERAETMLPDAQLERIILEAAQAVVAAALGEPDPARVGFVVLEEGGGQRVAPLARVVAEIEKRHGAGRAPKGA